MSLASLLFGQGAPLEIGEAAVRAAITYLVGLAIVRTGSKRLLGTSTAFDVIAGVMVGSLLSRAINGGAPVAPTLVATAVLVAVHWTVGFLAHNWPVVDRMLNGRPTWLIEDGDPRHGAMRREGVSHADLEEAARLNAKVLDLREVDALVLERNGRFAVWRRRRPAIVEVDVEEGVQTVRVEIT